MEKAISAALFAKKIYSKAKGVFDVWVSQIKRTISDVVDQKYALVNKQVASPIIN